MWIKSPLRQIMSYHLNRDKLRYFVLDSQEKFEKAYDAAHNALSEGEDYANSGCCF